MVDKSTLDVVMSTIAVLIVPPQQPISIDQKELVQVLTRPLTIGQSALGLVVSSQRDQIELFVEGNKINVRDLSGKQEFSKNKIPIVLNFFFERSGAQPTKYGINFIINLPCVKSEQWIRDNILASKISEKTKKALIGSSATLKILSEPKTWNIKLEPGEGEIINVDFNSSEDIKELPNQNKLHEEMEHQFNALLGFLTDLGL